MEYTKPVITACANALAAIQGVDKGDEDLPDAIITDPNVSFNAYEADE
jgi:hypothetical protein